MRLSRFNFDTYLIHRLIRQLQEKMRKVANQVLKDSTSNGGLRPESQGADDYEPSKSACTLKDDVQHNTLIFDLKLVRPLLVETGFATQVEWQGTLMTAMPRQKDALGETSYSRV